MITALTATLIVLLTAYAFGAYGIALVFALRPKGRSGRDTTSATPPTDAVTVAVPARNEGEGALRCLRSLLAQDHAGPLTVALLLRDRDDTALPFLAAAFPEVDLDASPQRAAAEGEATNGATPEDQTVIYERGDRRVLVCFTGHDPKHLKVNWLTERLTTPWVAILDSDHRAHPDWISSCLARLHAGGSRLIQARREPLAAHGLFGLWDSLHQHIGCEVTNTAYARLGLPVFFTGTTAVMATSLLQANPLSDCLTEDTDLSFRLLLRGEALLYNPSSGSAEEVSPDLYSFLARRRRWAHGHTKAFLRHLRALPSARLPLWRRIQFVFHGAHYLLATLVFAVHALIGAQLIGRLPSAAQATALGAAALLAWALTRAQRARGWWRSLLPRAVIFTWLAPALVLVTNLTLALALGEPARAALPGSPLLQALALIGFLSPLAFLLIGLGGFRQLGLGSGLVVILTYPLAFYLDLAGVLIGLVDLLQGTHIWLAIARAPQPDGAPGAPPAPVGIRASWRSRSLITAAGRALRPRAVPPWRWRILKSSTWLLGGAVLVALGGGVYLSLPEPTLPLSPRACQLLPWDDYPWITKAERLGAFCGPVDPSSPPQVGHRRGSLELLRADRLDALDAGFWEVLTDTFPCNLARFSRENIAPLPGGGLALSVRAQVAGDRNYTAASIATKAGPEGALRFGRVEVELRAARGAGLITALFLYRFDPWQEIDAELLGRDPTKLLINVYDNPGEEGDTYNYGYRGTPVLIDLGFDAAAALHRYAIEWDPMEIRWFVDGALVHIRSAGRPTPIPQLPMRLHINVWPICSEELAGPIDEAALPATAELRSVSVSRWIPPAGGLPRDELRGPAPTWTRSGPGRHDAP